MRKHAASEESNEHRSKILKYTNDRQDHDDHGEDAFQHGYSTTERKPISDHCPLHWTSDGHIVLESCTSNYKRAQDLLFAIAESVNGLGRTDTYKLTRDSLHTAMFFGWRTQNIIEDLQEMSKTNLPSATIDLIQSCTAEYGRVRLVLKEHRYFVQSVSCDALRTLLQDPKIQSCRLVPTDQELQTTASSSQNHLPLDQQDLENSDQTSFEVDQSQIVLLRKRCQQLKYPLVEEYDFAHDTILPNLKIKLSSTALLRPYQEESLRKMFNNERVRSGVIVLPCGAGKSLVGVAAACTINKRCLVLCNSVVSAEQWREQFLRWSDANASTIQLFTSKNKNTLKDAGIYISTYQMIAPADGRSAETDQAMKLLTSRDWGLILLDEVHMAPADSFRQILTTVRAHVRLGLTATPVREDDKIIDLNFLVGSKLYEGNWMELQKAGFIAEVRCAEVQCQMTSRFLQEYQQTSDKAVQRRLSVFNPNKFRTCQFLIGYHERRDDKIIVYCDDVFAVKTYALDLLKPFIHGDVLHEERMHLLQNFQRNPKIKTIFISRVGDTSFDLPEASVVIQLSSHGGSRRQEAQRLGRILRTKRDSAASGNNAFFYSLVSQETDEMRHLEQRQQFLKDQGYAYQTLLHTQLVPDQASLHFSSDQEQEQLLTKALEGPGPVEETKVESPSSTGGYAAAQRALLCRLRRNFPR